MSSRLGHVMEILQSSLWGRRASEITINNLHNLNDFIRQRNKKS